MEYCVGAVAFPVIESLYGKNVSFERYLESVYY